MASHLGEAFARAVAAKDNDGVRQLLHPQLDFRAMTPRRVWEASRPEEVIGALNLWFEPSDEIEGIDAIDVDSFADLSRIGYRLRVRNADGPHLVEQQMYLSERDGQIGWMRIMCSGWRPID